MTPIPNHIYSCTWAPGGDTYINLVTDVSSTHIQGRCISSTDHEYFDINPDDFVSIEWARIFWNEDSPDATIIDLGHIDDLPELLL